MKQIYATDAFKKALAGIPGPAVRPLRLARFPLAVSEEHVFHDTLVCGYLPPGSTLVPKMFGMDDPYNLDSPFVPIARVFSEKEGDRGADFFYDAVEFVKPDGTVLDEITTITHFPEGCTVRLKGLSGADIEILSTAFLYILYL